jgi:hypothetical protein
MHQQIQRDTLSAEAVVVLRLQTKYVVARVVTDIQ